MLQKGVNPLHWAIMCGDPAPCEALVCAGADPHVKNEVNQVSIAVHLAGAHSGQGRTALEEMKLCFNLSTEKVSEWTRSYIEKSRNVNQELRAKLFESNSLLDNSHIQSVGRNLVATMHDMQEPIRVLRRSRPALEDLLRQKLELTRLQEEILELVCSKRSDAEVIFLDICG